MTAVKPDLWLAADASDFGMGGVALNLPGGPKGENLMQLFFDKMSGDGDGSIGRCGAIDESMAEQPVGYFLVLLGWV